MQLKVSSNPNYYERVDLEMSTIPKEQTMEKSKVEIRPFRFHVPKEAITDLRQRIADAVGRAGATLGLAGMGALTGGMLALGRWSTSRVREWSALHTIGRGGPDGAAGGGGSPVRSNGGPPGTFAGPLAEPALVRATNGARTEAIGASPAAMRNSAVGASERVAVRARGDGALQLGIGEIPNQTSQEGGPRPIVFALLLLLIFGVVMGQARVGARGMAYVQFLAPGLERGFRFGQQRLHLEYQWFHARDQ